MFDGKAQALRNGTFSKLPQWCFIYVSKLFLKKLRYSKESSSPPTPRLQPCPPCPSFLLWHLAHSSQPYLSAKTWVTRQQSPPPFSIHCLFISFTKGIEIVWMISGGASSLCWHSASSDLKPCSCGEIICYIHSTCPSLRLNMLVFAISVPQVSPCES